MGPVAVGGGLHRLGEGGVLDDGVEQTVQAHGAFHPGTGGADNANGPTRRTGRVVPDAFGPGVPSLRRATVTRPKEPGHSGG
ncbi:hypothetical protein GCM10010497_47720 [Streptomyces cinereoruber]|uniref:Uncharacterized protein n=1 Tax=Streptomyces cinereoruber TaxID=67260 RepID=A0AAV4KR67_9ACTN|nr:hypothetical protein GCM10010497_47720 [Streptomyces cinereoruber]